MSQKYLPTMVVALLLFSLTITAGGCDLMENFNSEAPSVSEESENVFSEPEAVDLIVDAAGPSVVTVTAKASGGGSGVSPFFDDPFFQRFFGDSFNFAPEQDGLGTGFLISKDGYILTNEHVIDGASKISIDLDGFDEPLEAKVIGADYNLDLALLKVDAKQDLPFLKMGNSDQVRVGSWVIAIGSPYGLDHTVTVGVISAKGRPVNVENRQYENLLQTDTSINPGNSGGPLLNLQGEVIGVNTAINAQAQGIGFAIPANTVQQILEDLKKGVSAEIPWVGVQVRDVDDEAAQYLGLAKIEGVLVTGVINGSPAQKAGLKQQDVIVELNGTRTNTADQMIAVIRETKVGQKVQILFYRAGILETVEVTIAERPRNVR